MAFDNLWEFDLKFASELEARETAAKVKEENSKKSSADIVKTHQKKDAAKLLEQEVSIATYDHLLFV